MIQTQFDIPYGDDNMLLGYQFMEGQWRPVFRWQSQPYDHVYGAYGPTVYAVSPMTADGNYYIVASHETTRSASNWSAILLQAFRPAKGSLPQKMIFTKDLGDYEGDGKPARLTAQADKFSIRYTGSLLDADLLVRPHVETYRISGMTVQRIQPAAMNARDFVDEWLQTPWSDAVNWSAATLQSAHDKLYTALQSKTPPRVTYDDVTACKKDKNVFQVAVDFDVKTNLFVLSQQPDGFTMLDISTKDRPGCGGHDLMSRH